MNATKTQALVQNLRVQLFADRGTDLHAAFTAASDLIQTLPSQHRITAYTAMHIVLNTAANIIEDIDATQGETK